MAIIPRLAIVTNQTHPEPTIGAGTVPLAAGGINIITTNLVLVVLTAIWTALRFWCRKVKGGCYYLEDWMHLGALLTFYGVVASNSMLVLLGGSGQHLFQLQPWHIVQPSKATYAVQVLFAISMGLVKLSITWMLMRIFVTVAFRRVAILVMCFTLAWIILTILTSLLICRPVAMNWDPYTLGGHCGDQVAVFASIGVIDVINELTILCLPIPMIWNLRMHRRYKIAVAAVLGAGLLTVAFAAVRLYTVLTIDFTDVSYSAVPTVIYGTVEPGIAIIVSCSPILRPVFDSTIGRLLTTDQSTTIGVNEVEFALKTFGGGEISNVKSKTRKFCPTSESEEHLHI